MAEWPKNKRILIPIILFFLLCQNRIRAASFKILVNRHFFLGYKGIDILERRLCRNASIAIITDPPFKIKTLSGSTEI